MKILGYSVNIFSNWIRNKISLQRSLITLLWLIFNFKLIIKEMNEFLFKN